MACFVRRAKLPVADKSNDVGHPGPPPLQGSSHALRHPVPLARRPRPPTDRRKRCVFGAREGNRKGLPLRVPHRRADRTPTHALRTAEFNPVLGFQYSLESMMNISIPSAKREIGRSQAGTPVVPSIFPHMTARSMQITIVYDNYVHDPAFRPGSGFACVARTDQGVILFDAGGHVSTLAFNLQKAGISPQAIDAVAISHLDSDHYGGLLGLLEKTKVPKVYVPAIFPARFKQRITLRGAEVREIDGPQEVLPQVFSTGQVGGGIKEQSLVLETSKGAVLIVGCGHPSITKIAESALGIVKKPLYMIVGGFHLGGMEERDLDRVFGHLKELGLRKVAPSHCSTDTGVAYLRREFGEGFVESGVGRVIKVE